VNWNSTDTHRAEGAIQDDSLPLSVLALLEPDPVAPSCIPGRRDISRESRVGHAGSCWECPHGITDQGVGESTTQLYSELLDSLNRHMNEAPASNANSSCNPTCFSTSQFNRGTCRSGASNSLGSPSTWSTWIPVDLDSKLLQSPSDLEGTFPIHSRPCQPFELESNIYGASCEELPSVPEYSLIFEYGMDSLPTSPLYHRHTCDHSQSAASLSSALPGTTSVQHRLPADASVDRNQEQNLPCSFSLSLLEGSSMPDPLVGEGLQSQRDRRGVTGIVDLKRPPIDQHDATYYWLRYKYFTSSP
jgi:hypothetical protein